MHGDFREKTLAIKTFQDGSDDELLQPLHYRAKDGVEYRCPVGSKTDGMSLPKIVRMIPGFNANRQDWFSAILHDGGYRGTLEIWDGETERWEKANLNRKQTDLLMKESMQAGKLKRACVYFPLRAFGWPNFKPAI